MEKQALSSKDRVKVGRWTVLPQQNCLRDGNIEKSIEPQCMALLLFLVENQGKVCSREDILDAVWGNIIVNENTLTKTLGMLRRGLEDDPKQPRYIATRLKKGYQLIAQVETDIFALNVQSIATSKQNTPERPSQAINLTNKEWLVAVAITVVFVVTIVMMFHSYLATHNNKVLNHWLPNSVTFDAKHETTPSFSNDGTLLIYSKYNNNTGFDIFLYHRNSHQHTVLINDVGNQLAAVSSPNGKHIAYFNKNKQKCELMKAELSEDSSVTVATNVLSQCGYNNEGKIAWLSDEVILFSDRNIENYGEHKLYTLNLASGYRQEIIGHYPLDFAVTDDKTTVILLVRKIGDIELTLSSLDIDTLEYRDIATGYPPLSQISWSARDRKIILVEPALGRVSKIASDGQKSIVYQTKSVITHPHVSPSGEITLLESNFKNELLEISNPIYADNQINTAPENGQVIHSSSYLHYLYRYGTGKTRAFLSQRNDQYHVWLQQGEHSHPIIDDFIKGDKVSGLKWSVKGNMLLIMQTDRHLNSYNIETGVSQEITLKKTPVYYLNWGRSESELILTHYQDTGPQVFTYDITTGKYQPFSQSNALTALFSPNGHITYFITHQQALWFRDERDGQVKLVTERMSLDSITSLKAFDDGVYWQENSDQHYSVYHYSLLSQQKQRIATVPYHAKYYTQHFDVTADQQKISLLKLENLQSDIVILSDTEK